MERYAPNAKDLAGRDVVARSMILEILDGRGCGPEGDHVFLKLDHLGEETLICQVCLVSCELSKTFAHVDPVRSSDSCCTNLSLHDGRYYLPISVVRRSTVDSEGNDQPIEGLFACGEVACVSVHGANRLGGNSLLDLVVFGRSAGMEIERKLMREGYNAVDLLPKKILSVLWLA